MPNQFNKRGTYPRLWEMGLIQANARKRANHRCEHCGTEFIEGTNLAVNRYLRNGNRMIGTVHHINMNKSDCSMNNLVYLCQSCHYTIHLYDWTPGKYLPLAWLDVPNWIIKRNLPYKQHLKLWNEESVTSNVTD